MPVNLYVKLLSSMNQKVMDYVDHLDRKGQIDRDSKRDPWITKYEVQGPGMYRVYFLRNGYEENFIINTRKRPDPSGIIEPIRKSFDPADGWVRNDEPQKKIVQDEPAGVPGGERRMRESFDYRTIVEGILNDRS